MCLCYKVVVISTSKRSSCRASVKFGIKLIKGFYSYKTDPINVPIRDEKCSIHFHWWDELQRTKIVCADWDSLMWVFSITKQLLIRQPFNNSCILFGPTLTYDGQTSIYRSNSGEVFMGILYHCQHFGNNLP